MFSTTSAQVDPPGRAQDDAEAEEVLETVSGFSRGGRLGENLTKALEERGDSRPNTAMLLWKRFNSRVDMVRKKTDIPSWAANLMNRSSQAFSWVWLPGVARFQASRWARPRAKVDTSGIL